MAGQGSKGGGVAANPAVPAMQPNPVTGVTDLDGYATPQPTQWRNQRNLVST